MFPYPETRDIKCPEYSDLPASWLLKRDNLLFKEIYREAGAGLRRGNCAVYSVFLWIPLVLFCYPEV